MERAPQIFAGLAALSLACSPPQQLHEQPKASVACEVQPPLVSATAEKSKPSVEALQQENEKLIVSLSAIQVTDPDAIRAYTSIRNACKMRVAAAYNRALNGLRISSCMSFVGGDVMPCLDRILIKSGQEAVVADNYLQYNRCLGEIKDDVKLLVDVWGVSADVLESRLNRSQPDRFKVHSAGPTVYERIGGFVGLDSLVFFTNRCKNTQAVSQAMQAAYQAEKSFFEKPTVKKLVTGCAKSYVKLGPEKAEKVCHEVATGKFAKDYATSVLAVQDEAKNQEEECLQAVEHELSARAQGGTLRSR